MSILNKVLLIGAMLASTFALARSDGIYNPSSNSVGDYQGIDSNAASGVAPTVNFRVTSAGDSRVTSAGDTRVITP